MDPTLQSGTNFCLSLGPSETRKYDGHRNILGWTTHSRTFSKWPPYEMRNQFSLITFLPWQIETWFYCLYLCFLCMRNPIIHIKHYILCFILTFSKWPQRNPKIKAFGHNFLSMTDRDMVLVSLPLFCVIKQNIIMKHIRVFIIHDNIGKNTKHVSICHRKKLQAKTLLLNLLWWPFCYKISQGIV